MAYERRSFAGGAIQAHLTAGINAAVTTFSINDATGWPTGSAGDFFVVIDRATATEEVVRCASRSSLTVTVATSGRGADGTTAASHATDATVEMCLTAVDLDEANAHITDDTRDDHSQYLNTARHDVEARHTFGAAYGTPATPADVGTANATGSGNNPAREDHVHQIGTGAIDTASQFAAGVVNAAAIGAGEVGTSELADDAVTPDKLATNSVTSDAIAADAVGSSEIAANAVGTSELADGAVDVGAIADGVITQAKFNAEAETSYTPTLGVWSLGNGTVAGSYVKYGRLVVFRALITLGSTTSAGASLTITAPFQAASSGWRFIGEVMDSTTSVRYPMVGRMTAGSAVINCLVEKKDAGDFVYEVDIASLSPLQTPFTSDTVSISGAFIADS